MTNITQPFITIGWTHEDKLGLNLDSTLMIGTDAAFFGNLMVSLAQAYTEALLAGGRGADTERLPTESDREQIEAQILATFVKGLSSGEKRIQA